MNKIFSTLILCTLLSLQVLAQNENKDSIKKAEIATLAKPYNENERADLKLKQLIKKAKKENKNIILQVGGNWCIWCLRLNDFITKNHTVKNTIHNNFLYYHLNYSPKNKNTKILDSYGNPGDKLGYPYLLVIDKNGKLLHTQETGALEEGKGYSEDKVMQFLNNWIIK